MNRLWQTKLEETTTKNINSKPELRAELKKKLKKLLLFFFLKNLNI